MSGERETILILGSTGNIGISAIIGSLRSGLNVLAAVRNEASAQKIYKHVPRELLGDSNSGRLITVEVDVLSDVGVQRDVVDKVRDGKIPGLENGFQHVYSTVGGAYGEMGLVDITTSQLKEYMLQNFEANFYAYRATIPYLLSLNRPTTFTVCTGASGDVANRSLPSMTQGAMFSFCYAASRELKDTNVRFNELYLARRVEVDSVAESQGSVKASKFSQVFEKVLADSKLKGSRVFIVGDQDFDTLRVENNEDRMRILSKV